MKAVSVGCPEPSKEVELRTSVPSFTKYSGLVHISVAHYSVVFLSFAVAFGGVRVRAYLVLLVHRLFPSQ